jgi:REP-associated tyrosine transposase
MSFYRRRLPHWQPRGTPIFLTWRLYGSLPKRSGENSSLSEGQRFVLLDRELDGANSGPMFLKNPQVAAAVIETFLTAANKWDLCELFARVVMSNHVHLLIQPQNTLSEVTRAIKKTSARQANIILGRSGLPFWQDESYDHWIRNGKQFDRILQYIESNPVERAEAWPWSSASSEWAGREPAPLKNENLVVKTVGQVPDLPK